MGRRRAYFLDEWRGLSVLLMLFYHTVYDLVFVFGVNIPIFKGAFAHYLQLFICGSFIFVAGTSCRFSRGNLKRGLKLLGVAFTINVITIIFMPQQRIIFGILHFLGCSVILFEFCKNLLDKLSVSVGVAIMLFLFVLTWNLPNGFIGPTEKLALNLPKELYSTRFLFAFGLPSEQFYSSDYFPLLPWIFWFGAGSFVGVLFVKNKIPDFFYDQHIKSLAWFGRNAIIIYVLHQPIMYGICAMVLGSS